MGLKSHQLRDSAAVTRDRPSSPIVGGRLTFPKGHLTIPKRSQRFATLRLPTPPMETPDPPSDTPGASNQVVLTPHDIPRSLRAGILFLNEHGCPDAQFELLIFFTEDATTQFLKWRYITYYFGTTMKKGTTEKVTTLQRRRGSN